MTSAFNESDECGENFDVNSAGLALNGANAVARVNATYSRWYCTYADLPQVECEDTWIEVGPLKTKGVPNCSTWMDTVRTSKNKLFQQSGSIDISIEPVLQNRYTIYLNPVVEDVHLDGFGQSFANLMNINVKNVAQNMIDTGINPNDFQFAVPPELRDYISLNSVEFYQDAGSLWLRARGNSDITSSALLQLCNRFWPAGKCSRAD